LKLQDWWKEPEITAKAAWFWKSPINKNPFQNIWGIFILFLRLL
jgi:hypothetical protein